MTMANCCFVFQSSSWCCGNFCVSLVNATLICACACMRHACVLVRPHGLMTGWASKPMSCQYDLLHRTLLIASGYVDIHQFCCTHQGPSLECPAKATPLYPATPDFKHCRSHLHLHRLESPTNMLTKHIRHPKYNTVAFCFLQTAKKFDDPRSHQWGK